MQAHQWLSTERPMHVNRCLRGGMIAIHVQVNTLSIPNIVLLSLHIIFTEGSFRFLDAIWRGAGIQLFAGGNPGKVETAVVR